MPCVAWNVIQTNDSKEKRSSESINSLLESIFDGFLFAVPKKRRTVEKRLIRKLGDDRWGFPAAKMLKPKKNLIICDTCGNYNEKGYLCPVCYKKVEEETKIVQEAIVNTFKLDPITQEVFIKYQSDSKEEVGNRKLIEVERERPAWFSKNLLSKLGQTLPEKSVILDDEVVKVKNEDK